MSEFYKRLLDLKLELKVNKTIRNDFGGFYYRSKEQILEALKPLEKKHDVYIKIDEELVEVGGRVYTKATAKVIDINDDELYETATSFAEHQKVGSTKMNESQLTGSASSYAGKYALGNLFGLDDSKDPDSHEETPYKAPATKSGSNLSEEKKKEILGESNDYKSVLYLIGQESINVTTPEQLNKLVDDLKLVSCNENEKIATKKVLLARGNQLKFTFNKEKSYFEKGE